MVIFIDNDLSERLLDAKKIIRAVEEGYKDLSAGKTSSRPSIDFYVPSRDEDQFYRWGTVEGIDVRNNLFAIRMKSDVIFWTKNGREEKYCANRGTYCGFVMLFDTNTGLPIAIVNDGYIQHMRVAASSVIGAKFLARKDSTVLSMVGSGGMARSHAEAYCLTFPIERIRIYSPSKTNRESFAREMSSRLGVDVVSYDSPEEATRGSDILLACTNSNEEVLNPDWVQPGMYVSVIRKVEAGQRLRYKVDILSTLNTPAFCNIKSESTIPGVGTVLGALGGASLAIAVGEQKLYSRFLRRDKMVTGNKDAISIFDIIAGREEGRTEDSQMTFFDNTEGAQGTQFAYVCGELVRQMTKENTKKLIPTEWFLENIRD